MGMETSGGFERGEGGWFDRFKRKPKKETPKKPQEELDKVIKEKIERPPGSEVQDVNKELEESNNLETLIKSGEPVYIRSNNPEKGGQHEKAKILDVLGNNVVLELLDSGEQTFRNKTDLLKQHQESQGGDRLKNQALGAAKASMDYGFKSTAFSAETGQYHEGEVRKIDNEAGEVLMAVQTKDESGLVSERIIKAPAEEWMAWQHHAGEEVDQ